ncbi:MAG: peptidylprolyl isomerase, partial [Kiritimatiellaeota bacterium]|nr:peptidylprolyl isomerase [Kiritimatiellota bacterium]
MQIHKSALFLATAAFLTTVGCADEPKAAPAPAGENDGVAVVIDKTIKITKAEVDKAVDNIIQRNAQFIPPEQFAQAKAMYRGNVKQQMIQQKILLREADKADIKATDAERDEFFAKATQGMTTIEAEAERAGMEVAELKEQIANVVRIQKLIDVKTAAVSVVTEADAKAYFDGIAKANPEALKTPESVEASHILVKIDMQGAADDEAKAKVKADAKVKIELIRAKALEDGADFAKLAEEFSDCPSGKRSGGSLGEFGRGQMVPEFDKAAFEQEIGVIGPIVETQFGFHIVKVEAREDAKEIAFDDVKAEIMAGLAPEAKKKTFGEFAPGVFATA